jgi:hypothetical protein
MYNSLLREGRYKRGMVTVLLEMSQPARTLQIFYVMNDIAAVL